MYFHTLGGGGGGLGGVEKIHTFYFFFEGFPYVYIMAPYLVSFGMVWFEITLKIGKKSENRQEQKLFLIIP